MLQKQVSIGLLALLLCHTLASVLVGIAGWWQAEADLSERLSVYRSVDSLVEFQIPLTSQTDALAMTRATEGGFRYRGHSYAVVSLDMQHDTLHIAGLETRNHPFWQEDLLTFLEDHLATSSDTGEKASKLLKFLLKEYSPSPSSVLQFRSVEVCQFQRIPDAPFAFLTRTAPIHSPPPERAA